MPMHRFLVLLLLVWAAAAAAALRMAPLCRCVRVQPPNLPTPVKPKPTRTSSRQSLASPVPYRPHQPNPGTQHPRHTYSRMLAASSMRVQPFRSAPAAAPCPRVRVQRCSTARVYASKGLQTFLEDCSKANLGKCRFIVLGEAGAVRIAAE